MKTSAKVFSLLLAVLMVTALLVPTVLADEVPTEGYTSVTTGFTGIPAEYAFSAEYVSSMTILESSNTPDDAGNPRPTALDNQYKYAGVITLGEDAYRQEFLLGLGMHPKKGTDESWTSIDISGSTADRFYSVVGLTNTASNGVIFQVYGDYGDGTYKLLCQSETITGKKTGEFDIEITGVKTLRLVVITPDGNHASSACAWGNTALYSTAVKDTTPPETEAPTTEATEATEEETKETQKPTTNKPSVNTPSDTAAEDNSTPVGLIIGIVAGVLVVAGVVVFLVIKKKK